MGSSVILTGGWDDVNVARVTEYSEVGFIKDFPSLQQKREFHGCSYYENNEGTNVDIVINYCDGGLFMSIYILDTARIWWPQ